VSGAWSISAATARPATTASSNTPSKARPGLTTPKRDSNYLTYVSSSEQTAVEARFVISIPATLNLKAVPPLLRASITTCSPLCHWTISKGQKVGVIGLGHMGVNFAKALGAHVVMIMTSSKKGKDAIRLGATEV